MSALASSVIAGYLQTAYQQACQRLSELDTLPATTRAYMTYTEGGHSYSWSEYRQKLLDQIEQLGGSKDKPSLIQIANGPFEVHSW